MWQTRGLYTVFPVGESSKNHDFQLENDELCAEEQ